MTTIHTGNTTTTGFIVTSDNSGNLVVKTGGSGGTTALTIGDDQRVTFAQPPLTSVPAFRAYADTSQSVTSGVFTLVEINNKTGDDFFDTNNWFDTSTYRFTPSILTALPIQRFILVEPQQIAVSPLLDQQLSI